MAYSVAADVRIFARGIDSAMVDDTTIGAFIAAADAIIDDYFKHDWQQHADEVEYYDGNGLDKLILRNYPLISVSEIATRGASGFGALTVYNPATNEGTWEILKLASSIIRWHGTGKPSMDESNIKVTYTYGYASTPQKIKDLSAMIAASFTLMRAAGEVAPEGLVSISEGKLSLGWGSGPYQETIGNLQAQINATLANIGRRLLIGTAEGQ